LPGIERAEGLGDNEPPLDLVDGASMPASPAFWQYARIAAAPSSMKMATARPAGNQRSSKHTRSLADQQQRRPATTCHPAQKGRSDLFG
jgi:hypothetical protein